MQQYKCLIYNLHESTWHQLLADVSALWLSAEKLTDLATVLWVSMM